MAYEVWTPDDIAFKEHCVYCGICDNDGYPLNAAYRPHALSPDCWCVRTNSGLGKCWLAIEYGMTQPSARRDSVTAVIERGETIMSAAGFRLQAGEFREAFYEAMADLRRDIAIAR